MGQSVTMINIKSTTKFLKNLILSSLSIILLHDLIFIVTGEQNCPQQDCGLPDNKYLRAGIEAVFNIDGCDVTSKASEIGTGVDTGRVCIAKLKEPAGFGPVSFILKLQITL